MCASATAALASLAFIVAVPTASALPHRALAKAEAVRPARAAQDTWTAQRGRKKAGKGKTKDRKGDSGSPRTPSPPVPVIQTPPPAELPSPPPLSGKYKAVALLPFESNDVPEEMLRAIELSMANEIDEKSGSRTVSPRDVASEAAGFGLSVDKCAHEDLACLARLARYARAHLAILTRLGAFGGTLKLSLRLLDTQSGAEVARVAESLSDKPEERANELHRMLVQLLTPNQYVGTLVLQSKEVGADVYLNDKLIGTTPIKGPLKNLTAGPYILRVSKAGFADLYQFVDVIYKKTSTITFDLATNTITGTINVTSETGFGSVFVVTNLPDVEIRIDGEPRGTAPLDGPIPQVVAGKRRLSLRREGSAPHAEEIDVRKNERTDVGVFIAASGKMSTVATHVGALERSLPKDPESVDPNKVAAVKPDGPKPPVTELRGPSWLLPAGLVTGGAGALSLMVSGYFANKVRGQNNEAGEIYERCTERVCQPGDRERLNALNESGPSTERKQWITLGLGVGFVAIGGALVLSDMMNWFAPEPSTSVSGPGGAGAAGLGGLPLDGGALLFYSSSF